MTFNTNYKVDGKDLNLANTKNPVFSKTKFFNSYSFLKRREGNTTPKFEAVSSIFVTGNNGDGLLGVSGDLNLKYSSPVQLGANTDWVQIFVGSTHGFAIKRNGTLWAWGRNDLGQLGTNDQIHRSSPIQIAANTNWKYISCGLYHTLAIKTDGTLWSWGDNLSGQIGDNSILRRSSPVQIGANTSWYSVAAGKNYSVALKADGTAWGWGTGSGSGIGISGGVSSPVQIGTEKTWRKIFAGDISSAAIKTDGTLWTWGDNSQGRLGFNDTVNRSSPVQVGSDTNWLTASIGYSHCVAIKTDGTLWSWGDGSRGALGIIGSTNRSSPTQVTSAGNFWNDCFSGYQSTFAEKLNGTLYAWGNNDGGVLGLGNTVDRTTPTIFANESSTWVSVAPSKDISSNTATIFLKDDTF